MISRLEQRALATEKVAAHLLATGLSRTSVRELAGAAGVSDRMLLYYFADKEDVMTAALERVAELFAVGLDAGIPAGDGYAPAELLRRAVALLTDGPMRPAISLWIEIVAAAGRDEAPFPAIAEVIAARFLDWIESRLAPGENRRADAAMIFAMIDGLAILGACAPADLIEDALEAMARRLE